MSVSSAVIYCHYERLFRDGWRYSSGGKAEELSPAPQASNQTQGFYRYLQFLGALKREKSP